MLAVDPISWLAWEFPMAVQRQCPRSTCFVDVDRGQLAASRSATGAAPAGDPGGGGVRGVAATAYLSSFGGRPNPVVLPPHPRAPGAVAVMDGAASSRASSSSSSSAPAVPHVNAVVFMENDARVYSAGREGLLHDVADTFGGRLDLALGYRPAPPWQHISADGGGRGGNGTSGIEVDAGGSIGGGVVAGGGVSRVERRLAALPWRRVSYINDPLASFATPPRRFLQPPPPPPRTGPQTGPEKSPVASAAAASVGTGSSGLGGVVDDGSLWLERGVAFFSSQCDPVLAAARLGLVARLAPALSAHGVRFASFGRCFHTEVNGPVKLP